MAKIVVFVSTLILMLLTVSQPTLARPAARRGLIDGSEFLSLFINSASKGSSANALKQVDSNDNLEEQFSGFSGFGTTQKDNLDTVETSSKHDRPGDINDFQLPHDEQPTTTNSLSTITQTSWNDNTSQTKTNKSSNREQIVQYVKTGSKVIFLEELTGFDALQKEQNSNDVSSETTSLEHTTKAINSSISSDQDMSSTELDVTEIDAAILVDNDGPAAREIISHSHKAELSVDDSDPVMHRVADSASSESNVHETLKNPDPQKPIVPIQTVIYHDNYHKGMSAQPRSVSYSSISQSIDQPNSWPNSDVYHEARKNVSEGLQPKNYQEPAKVYSEPAKVYGEPEKVYSEPAKVYSQPAQVYSQPSKFYSEPAKVYSEPAKVYSEPAKVYSEPAKTYWPTPPTTVITSTTSTTTSAPKQANQRKVVFNLDKLPYDLLNAPNSNSKLLEPTLHSHASSSFRRNNLTGKQSEEDDGSYRPEHHNPQLGVTQRPSYRPTHYTDSPEELWTPTPEQNYEIEESVSVKTNGRAHGVQPASPSTVHPKEDSKVGYVFEGRNYRKYRVEEKTPDGFIVGEYGVVSHNDGSLRGVRYTADSNINPSLIHDALMKFLSL